jgi:hypothetical protein
MTKKRHLEPSVNQWFIELEAVIRHEILCYLVETKMINDGGFFFDGLVFISILNEQMNATGVYLDKIFETKDDIELAELENTVGSLAGQHQTERFLDEQDFLLQVIKKNNLKELSKDAQKSLTDKYPLAIRTVEYLINAVNDSSLPLCLWSPKLNEDFRIINLCYSNDLIEILEFHVDLLKIKKNKTKQNTQLVQKEPKLVTSNKKYQYIDIMLTGPDNHLQLISNYKISKIAKLDEPYQKQILEYCDNLLKKNVMHYLKYNTLLKEEDLTSPPPEKLLASRYDSYLPLLLGLHCVKNEHLYKPLKNREYEVDFDSFRDFVQKELYEKMDFLKEQFIDWRKKNSTDSESDDLKIYIDQVLTKKIKINIKNVKDLIKKFDTDYFSFD